ncbi:MAG: AAA family ATPase [Pseudomonadota bacterium]
MRIHVTGNAGAGKTTLSKALAQQFKLPVKHLDSVVWAPHWQKPDPGQKMTAIKAMCEEPDWVIDGVSDMVRERADVVIYLNTPRYLCMYRCIRRCFQWGFSTRPELPEHCPEIKVLFKAIKIVWRFPGTFDRRLKAEAENNSKYILSTDVADAGHQLSHVLTNN